MLKRFFSIVICILPMLVFAEDFVPGKDYEIINQLSAKKVESAGIPVVEFFSYGCPWCYRIESFITEWTKQQGNKIAFSRVPVVFNKDWEPYAKAYYTIHLLGLEATLNPALFTAIQTQKQVLNTNQAMIDFFIAK